MIVFAPSFNNILCQIVVENGVSFMVGLGCEAHILVYPVNLYISEHGHYLQNPTLHA